MVDGLMENWEIGYMVYCAGSLENKEGPQLNDWIIEMFFDENFVLRIKKDLKLN